MKILCVFKLGDISVNGVDGVMDVLSLSFLLHVAFVRRTKLSYGPRTLISFCASSYSITVVCFSGSATKGQSRATRHRAQTNLRGHISVIHSFTQAIHSVKFVMSSHPPRKINAQMEAGRLGRIFLITVVLSGGNCPYYFWQD